MPTAEHPFPVFTEISTLPRRSSLPSSTSGLRQIHTIETRERNLRLSIIGLFPFQGHLQQLMSIQTPTDMGISQSTPSMPHEIREVLPVAPTNQDLPQEARLNISDLFAYSSPEQLEAGVEKGVSILDELKTTLEVQAANSVDAAQWLQSINAVRNQAIRTRTIVGVVGHWYRQIQRHQCSARARTTCTYELHASLYYSSHRDFV